VGQLVHLLTASDLIVQLQTGRLGHRPLVGGGDTASYRKKNQRQTEYFDHKFRPVRRQPRDFLMLLASLPGGGPEDK